MKTAKLIDNFLAEHRELAGSRDGYPALALSLNQCRELAEYVSTIHEHRERLLSIIYNSAVGECAMGIHTSCEELARMAYEITGTNAAEID